jgi:outer membrane lipoprotein-sorting protein
MASGEDWRYTVGMKDTASFHHIEKSSRERKSWSYTGKKLQSWAFAASITCTALLVLVLLVYPSRGAAAGPAANAELETVLNGSRQRIEKLDYRLNGRLTRVEGDGKRTNYKFVAKAHWFPDGLRLLCEITGTGAQKTSLLVHMSTSGQMSIQAIRPGEKTASVLPFEHWSDSLVGTDFTYEDMVEGQYFWKNQELQAPEKFGMRDCFVLKSKAGSQDRSGYDSVTSWIDRKIFFPVHVTKTIHGTGSQKEFLYYGLKQVSGAWGAMQVEAKQQGKPGSSMLVIETGSGKANLTAKDFDLSQFKVQ